MHHPHFGMEKMEQRLRKLSQVKEEVMMKKAHPTLLFHFLDNPFHILLNLPFSVQLLHRKMRGPEKTHSSVLSSYSDSSYITENYSYSKKAYP